ncbi:type II toxin-antitoxin system VapC family toxin [candidate division KSB1 bacterium]|nr:type II toxin-antitoxin system VapC family toxin [candidate division KSB1 bacterium]
MNLVDSSGWLEYFSDGANADFFSPAIEDTKNLLVSAVNLFEVFRRILEQRDENAAFQAVALMQQAQVVDVDASVALEAARINGELKLTVAASIVIATARAYKATLWTQDADFKKLADVKYIKK